MLNGCGHYVFCLLNIFIIHNLDVIYGFANDNYYPRETFIGATDSAVPCAMLLEMAHTLGPLLHNRRRKVLVSSYENSYVT